MSCAAQPAHDAKDDDGDDGNDDVDVCVFAVRVVATVLESASVYPGIQNRMRQQPATTT